MKFNNSQPLAMSAPDAESRCGTPVSRIRRTLQYDDPPPAPKKQRLPACDHCVFLWWRMKQLEYDDYFSKQLLNDHEREVWAYREWVRLTPQQQHDCASHARRVLHYVRVIILEMQG